MRKVIVFDFDGTLTDPNYGVMVFFEGCLESYAKLSKQPLVKIKQIADKVIEDITNNPSEHALIYNGLKVCHASDSYMIMSNVTRKIFGQFHIFENEPERSQIIGKVFEENYEKVTTVFREETWDLMKKFFNVKLKHRKAYIVTNSKTDSVKKKLEDLMDLKKHRRCGWSNNLFDNLYGSAKKFIIDPDFDLIDSHMTISNLNRPVFLRRKHYYNVLEDLLKQSNCDWSDLLVVGDIFELDLALPLHMGAQVVLMENTYTPDYEIEFVHNHPRGHVIENLNEVFDLL